MKHALQRDQINSFIATALALTSPTSARKRTRKVATANTRAVRLLTPFKRLIRAGVELRMNNMQLAFSLQTIDCHLSRMNATTLSQYISTFRTHHGMPRTKGFLSQW
jgi:hypothetical protein